jgi:hypothetical protein
MKLGQTIKLHLDSSQENFHKPAEKDIKNERNLERRSKKDERVSSAGWVRPSSFEPSTFVLGTFWAREFGRS